MSSRPASELMRISTQRGLAFERFYRELYFSPHRSMGWYAAIGRDHVVYLGPTLDAARALLENMQPARLNVRLAKAIATVAAVSETPPTPAPPATTITRRRSKR